MKTKITLAVAALAFMFDAGASAQVSVDLAGYPARYMGGHATFSTAPNGAAIYDKALEAVKAVGYAEKIVEKITDGVWVIGGYSLVNCIVIEAPDGLIVYDTGDNAEEGKHFREVIEEKISKRPIKAIIYSHSHYALGGGALVDDPKSVMVIGHSKLNETVKTNSEGGDEPSFSSTAPFLTKGRMQPQPGGYCSSLRRSCPLPIPRRTAKLLSWRD